MKIVSFQNILEYQMKVYQTFFVANKSNYDEQLCVNLNYPLCLLLFMATHLNFMLFIQLIEEKLWVPSPTTHIHQERKLLQGGTTFYRMRVFEMFFRVFLLKISEVGRL